MTLNDYIHRHYKAVDEGCPLRLGQRFFNDFLKNEDDIEGAVLFYERNDNKSIWMIEKWLQDKHYYNELPPILERG